MTLEESKIVKKEISNMYNGLLSLVDEMTEDSIGDAKNIERCSKDNLNLLACTFDRLYKNKEEFKEGKIIFSFDYVYKDIGKNGYNIGKREFRELLTSYGMRPMIYYNKNAVSHKRQRRAFMLSKDKEDALKAVRLEIQKRKENGETLDKLNTICNSNSIKGERSNE
jgi:hypothetical protein